MKYGLLIFLFYLIPIWAIANWQTKEDQNYIDYHRQINEAEIFLSDEKYGAALHSYEQLFARYDFIFLRDIKIAAQLALYLNEKEKAFDYLKKAIAAGWEIGKIRKNEILSALQDDPEWELIENTYSVLRGKYLARIEQPTRDKVHKMFKKDQRKAMGALIRIGARAKDRYALKKFVPHSETQMAKLILILNEFGYPGERGIGNDYWVSTIISHHNSMNQEYTRKDTLYRCIKPKLLQAIEKGQMSPFEYALIDDWYKAVASGRTAPGYGYLQAPDKSTLTETNLLRRKIGLRSIALRNKLVELENKTGIRFFLPDWVKGKIYIEQQ